MLLFCFIIGQQYGGVPQNASRGLRRGVGRGAGRGLRWGVGRALNTASSMGKNMGQL